MHKCVRIHLKSVQRNPLFKKTVRTGLLMKKNIIRTTLVSVAPSVLDDFVLHHAHVDINEALHLTTDLVFVNSLSAIASVVSVLAKL